MYAPNLAGQPTLAIAQATMPECRSDVQALFAEYLRWGNMMLDQEYGIRLDVEAMLKDDMTAVGKFEPPAGRLLLAELDAAVVGCIALRKIGPDVGEIKRMYVRPEHRGNGIGRALLDAVLDHARQAGYTCARLDSARFMREAHALYRSAGFREIGPYSGSEIPEEYRHHWVFMEKLLAVRSA